MAGYAVLWASEFVPAAQATYRANHPDTPLDARDIRLVKPEEILAAVGKARGEVDVLEGSPPCASFSTAGKRATHWGPIKKYSDVKQRTDDLFFEFIRILDGVRPKVFVAENVSGLVKGIAKGYFKIILAAMKAVGYRVEARLLDAQWLGVPQSRQRIIFVGTRDDLPIRPAHPRPLTYRYSVREAIPWLAGLTFTPHGPNSFDVPAHPMDGPAPAVCAGEGGTWAGHEARVVEDTGSEFGAGDVTDRPAPTVRASGDGQLFVERVVHDTSGGRGASPSFSQGDVTERPCPAITVGVGGLNSSHYLVEKTRVEGDISAYSIGEEWDKLGPGQQSDKYMNLVRTDPERPCPTVTQMGGSPGIASVTHPVEKRKFTIAELKRICAFPDDFVLTGTYAQQWERLGRAVPPLMMRAIARTIKEEIFDAIEGRR